MARIIDKGLLPPDHPIYSSGPEIFTPMRRSPIVERTKYEQSISRAEQEPGDLSEEFPSAKERPDQVSSWPPK